MSNQIFNKEVIKVIFIILKKYLGGILSSCKVSFKNISYESSEIKSAESNEETRKYYEKKWNNYFQHKDELEDEFVLDKGDWISNANGIFGVGNGFTSKGSIKCSNSNRKFIINLNENIIGHSRNDVLYNGQLINVISGSKCEIRNGTLKARNVCDKGSAIYVGVNGFLDCRACYFENSYTNRSGGVIYCCESSNIKLTDCNFNKNSANGFGGAIFVESKSSFECVGCEFTDNQSKFARGGAIYFEDDSKKLYLKDCTFKHNKSRNCDETVFVGNGSNITFLDCDYLKS